MTNDGKDSIDSSCEEFLEMPSITKEFIMKQKRILAAILAALMACPVFVSCAETPKNEKETFLAESSHESEEDTYVHDNLPEDLDYKGDTIVFICNDTLTTEDDLREVLKHGTLSIGFIGLAETLTALYGHHHGESEELQQKGLEIVGFMRDYCDRKSNELKMNFTLLATPAEGLAGRFIRMDQKRYGELPGITDREYYTNSFHIPVWHTISAYDKIRLEAPYHALCNAGHISYVELDGDTAKNVDAFEAIVRCMHDHGVGYGSINHPVDRDPVCGYVGVIGDTCPRCGRRENEGVRMERIRRITGYLVGTMDKWNNAKKAEERDRVKHGR